MFRAVFFDAVGTLINPRPAPAEVYFEIGRRHNSRLTLDEIAHRFRAAFRHEDAIDREHGWKTDEPREERRWRNIVAAVLDDVGDGEACFRELWHHFSQPEAWSCVADAERVLAELSRRGYPLGMASNFDSRLRGVVAGLPELAPLHLLTISSEIGWRKPARQFFERLLSDTGSRAEEILFVGDDPLNDADGARAAGLSVVLLGAGGVEQLGDVLPLLPPSAKR